MIQINKHTAISDEELRFRGILGTPYNGTKLSGQPCFVTWELQKAESSCLAFYQPWLNTIRSIRICLRGYMIQHGRVDPVPFG